MNSVTLPTTPGSYRWYYLDVTAGQYTAVAIFMIGSIFSHRYSRSRANPRQHAAVNFAFYENGTRRHWVLTEYQQVNTDGNQLQIGNSSLQYEPNRLLVNINDVTAIWGKPISVTLELTPEGPGHAPIQLVQGLSHHWHPIAPRAHATIQLDGLHLEGRGYHDGNHGDVPLGSDLRGWDWTRSHAEDRTTIHYRPWTTPSGWQVEVDATRARVQQVTMPPPRSARTAWGLPVPQRPSTRLLESSPFYARLETGANTLGEVADFHRFHRPWIRWMAAFRTRIAS